MGLSFVLQPVSGFLRLRINKNDMPPPKIHVEVGQCCAAALPER